MLKKHGKTVMMDATHNVAKGLNCSKAYLYTLVLKNKKTNRGTPVAFVITESAS
jgi:archaellin